MLKARFRFSEAACLFHAAAVALLVPVFVRLDLHRLQRLLEPRPCSTTPALAVQDVIDLVGRHVDGVIRRGKPLIRPGCLTRAITSYYLLRRAGLDVALCFGIGSAREPNVVGHCWVVFADEPVLESVDPRSLYAEMARLSARGVTTPDPLS